jgi:hypothetical protein
MLSETIKKDNINLIKTKGGFNMENRETGNRNITGENAVVANKVNNARKEGIARGALVSAIISLLLLIVAGAIVYSLYKQGHNKQLALMETQRISFTKQVAERDSLVNDWLLTFDQIENDLNLIKQKENIITVKSSDSEFSKTRKDQILNDIRYINTLLESNKKKIASLSAQLKNSGGTIKGLQTRIASLETTVKQYETEMAALKETLVQKEFEIGQLNTRMTALEVTVQEKDSQIIDQTDLLNQAYLTSGTFKELKEKGIVSKEGGFLGLGRKESLVKDLNDNLFSKIDVRETKTIPVNSKDAKLITNHPSGSYEMVHEGNNRIASIEITDPDMFWKISKYAVVEIIK